MRRKTHTVYYHYYIHIKNIIHTQNSRAITDSSSSFPRLWRPNNILCCGWSLKSFKSQFVENVMYMRTCCQHLTKKSQLMHLTELSELLAEQPPFCLECCSMEMRKCCLCTGHPATKK